MVMPGTTFFSRGDLARFLVMKSSRFLILYFCHHCSLAPLPVPQYQLGKYKSRLSIHQLRQCQMLSIKHAQTSITQQDPI